MSASSTEIVLKQLPGQLTSSQLHSSSSAAIQHHRGWSPYNINEGTSLAVSGPDYCIVAGDTRMSDGYTILSRTQPKIYQLTSKCILSTAGMQAEASTLQKVLTTKIIQYQHRHGKEISTPAIAQMLSNTLYYKRFFPYYTFNLLGGIDANGVGCCYGYDAVGSFERIPYGVTGSASALATSILDNQVEFKTHLQNKRVLSVEEMMELVKDVYTSCAERDIYTGDSVDIAVITKEGIKVENFKLRRD